MPFSLRPRELAFVPGEPAGAPDLRLASKGNVPAWMRIAGLGVRTADWLQRFFGRESRIAARGSIALYADRARVERDPVRLLGERQPVQLDLHYEDITRLEYLAPGTIIVGYGVVAPGLHEQAAITLEPIEAHDKFDGLVEFLEDRDPQHLFSVRDGDRLAYSRSWTMAERFPDEGLIKEMKMQLLRLHPVPSWGIRTNDGRELAVESTHGLVMVDQAAPERAVMQMFPSQVLDHAGFTLGGIQTRSGRRMVEVGSGDVLGLDRAGTAWVGEEAVGVVPLEPMFTPRPETLTAVFGAVPSVQAELGKQDERVAQFRRPLPKSWAMIFALLSLLQPKGAPSAT